jgi:hypothetical protein
MAGIVDTVKDVLQQAAEKVAGARPERRQQARAEGSAAQPKRAARGSAAPKPNNKAGSKGAGTRPRAK